MRYRREGDRYCIDLRVQEIRQLFDLRDPAPFRERDLDPGAVEYVVEAVEETPARAPLKIEVHCAEPQPPSVNSDSIRASFKAYFEHALEVQGMKIRAHMRQGRSAVIVGVTVLTACLLLANAITPSTTWQRVLREGLVIGGWVAIWRPVEHFLYDWWPILAQRRLLRRIAVAGVEVRWSAARRSTVMASAEA
jgi:hypothetical protein